MTTFYDRDGNEIEGGVLAWAEMYENHDYRRIARDDIPGGFTVSTIWQGFEPTGLLHPGMPGNIFQTVVFRDKEVLDVLRWATEKEALEGHKALVQQVQEPDYQPGGAFRYEREDSEGE